MKFAKLSVMRLFQYKDFLIRAKSIGIKNLFSDDLAEAMGTTSTQVRKDFSLFGLSGNKRAGYNIDDLLEQLNELLGKNEKQRVVIVGAGNIGRALMKYSGFYKEGLEIVALFDSDINNYNASANPPVLPLESLYEFICKYKIEIGVIAVPYHAAQQVLDIMILAGIKGVMNFAPIALKSPKDFYINDVNLKLELESVAYFVKALKMEQEEQTNDV
ncbi:MAG: redox-sensing transcriptional repressor Rex [Candidatus Omnitrophica bacterium]|nr:redox-sensing transcriptional repressor Rex [Candidatus Omnitrophota bacterium]MBU1995531.1 redox-sensing transcriptional repressor Rex [Candidatus Omnitrophota bacterium]MBU4334436.1 redox-sensing transcriptional repressor Rex [Candidatus Omnitrophota bacterium]